MEEAIQQLYLTLLNLPISALLYLNPGVPADVVKQAIRDLSITLPTEVFELYEWKNGTALDNNEIPVGELYIMCRGSIIEVERAVEHYKYFTENELEYYSKYYFPIIEGFGEEFLVIDCDPKSSTYRMILSYEIKHVFLSGGAVPVYDSLQAMLETVNECYQKKAYFYSEGDARLNEDYELEVEITKRLNPKATSLAAAMNTF